MYTERQKFAKYNKLSKKFHKKIKALNPNFIVKPTSEYGWFEAENIDIDLDLFFGVEKPINIYIELNKKEKLEDISVQWMNGEKRTHLKEFEEILPYVRKCLEIEYRIRRRDLDEVKGLINTLEAWRQ